MTLLLFFLNDFKTCVCHTPDSNKRNRRDKESLGQSRTFSEHIEGILNHILSKDP